MQEIAVEGYAALFGAADLVGDVVRAGAFRESLARRRAPLPLLLHHEQRLLAGRWREAREDGRGLFLRGLIEADAPAARRARRMLERGVDGLSIGFITHASEPIKGGGRLLIELELLEVSIVALPMQPLARLNTTRASARAA
ncbi:MAG: HK97 family phage prohead protease [Hyphomonadaceae bacterium]|nr:HK97 family phage prohead protease [Hyphomonadaceae bacterium]